MKPALVKNTGLPLKSRQHLNLSASFAATAIIDSIGYAYQVCTISGILGW